MDKRGRKSPHGQRKEEVLTCTNEGGSLHMDERGRKSSHGQRVEPVLLSFCQHSVTSAAAKLGPLAGLMMAITFSGRVLACIQDHAYGCHRWLSNAN